VGASASGKHCFDTDLVVSLASAYTDFNRTLEVLRTNESSSSWYLLAISNMHRGRLTRLTSEKASSAMQDEQSKKPR